MLSAPTAVADKPPAGPGNKQVVVCKYVNTPELKEYPHHVIIVSESTLKNDAPTWNGTTFPVKFADAHWGSVAIRFAADGEQAQDVDLSECPGPPGKTAKAPAGITITDPCGPNNVSWVAKADEFFTYSQTGNTVRATLKNPALYFATGTTEWSLVDSNEPCELDVPAAPATSDPCGPANIAFVLPADTVELDWTLLGNGNVTVAPKAPYKFKGASQLVTFTLPADSNAPCDIQVPAAPSTLDPCNPSNVTSNISFVLPADTAELDWTLLGNGNVTVAPKAPYKFVGANQLVTFTLPADSAVPCDILGVQEIAPTVTFADPTCKKLDRFTSRGQFPDLVDYAVTGTPGFGSTITVTAAIKAAVADQYKFVDGYDNTFVHRYPTLAELNCVAGEETIVPKPTKNPDKKPVVLGTQAAVPSAVAAGIGGGTDGTTVQLLGQLLVAIGLVLLVTGGWLRLGRRRYGVHQV